MNNKGFSLPIVIFFIVAFLALPVIFFLYTSKNNRADEVKGVSTNLAQKFENGVGVSITSLQGTWDLVQYLCKDRDECVQSLVSGKKLGIVSGGVADGFKVRVSPGIQWEGNEYLKIYITPGWGSYDRNFKVDIKNDPNVEAFLENFEEDSQSYDAVIVPLEYFRDNYLEVVSFSDF